MLAKAAIPGWIPPSASLRGAPYGETPVLHPLTGYLYSEPIKQPLFGLMH